MTTVIRAERLFDDCCSLILQEGGYLDAHEIHQMLIDKAGVNIDMKRIERFRRIQQYNSKIDSDIEVYWFANPVRLYYELEDRILNNLNKMLKLQLRLESFIELGMGALRKNKKIIHFFGALQSETPRVEKQKIIELFHDFLIKNRGKMRGNDASQQEDNWNMFLSRQLKITRPTGIEVHFMSLYHSFEVGFYSGNVEKEIGKFVKKLRVAFIEEKTAALKIHFQNISIQKPKVSTLDSCLGIEKFIQSQDDINEGYTWLKELINPSVSVLDNVDVIIASMSNNAQLDLKRRSKSMFKIMNAVSSTIAALIVILQHVDIQRRVTPNSVNKFEILETLRSQYAIDVPTIHMSDLLSMLNKSMKKYSLESSTMEVNLEKNIFEIELDKLIVSIRDQVLSFKATLETTILSDKPKTNGKKPQSTKIRFNKASSSKIELPGALSDLIETSNLSAADEKNEKSAIEVHVVPFSASEIGNFELFKTYIVGCVLFHRLLLIEINQIVVELEPKARLQSSLSKTIERYLSSSERLDLSVPASLSVIRTVSAIEDHVKKDLNLISFETMFQGTFSSFILSQESSLKLFEKLDHSFKALVNGQVVPHLHQETSMKFFDSSDISNDMSYWCSLVSETVSMLLDSVQSDKRDRNIYHYISLVHLIEKTLRSKNNDVFSRGNLTVESLSGGLSIIAILDEAVQFDDKVRNNLKALAKEFGILYDSDRSPKGADSVGFDDINVDADVLQYEYIVETASYLMSNIRKLEAFYSNSQAYFSYEGFVQSFFRVPKNVALTLLNRLNTPKCFQSTSKHLLILDPSIVASQLNTLSILNPVLLKSDFDVDLIQLILSRLSKVPSGLCIGQYILWNELWANRLVKTSAVTIIDFISLYADEIYQHDPFSKYIVVLSGISHHAATYDCLRIHLVFPSKDNIGVAMKKMLFSKLSAAICSSIIISDEIYNCQADLNSFESDGTRFQDNLKGWFLEQFESRGNDAVESLILDLLILSVAIPLPYNSTLYSKILMLLFSCLQIAAILNVETVTKEVLYFSRDKLRHTHSIVFIKLVLYWWNLDVGQSSALRLLKAFADSVVRDDGLWRLLEIFHSHCVNFQSSIRNDANDNGSAKNDEFLDSVVASDRNNASVLEETVSSTRYYHNISTENIVNAKAYVQNLLRTRFRYDGGGNRPTDKALENEDVKNSLDLLSANLYSSDVHFVMEVLQNADDNIYHKNSIPTIKFELYPHAIVIFNNEVGFQQQNISAVCRVGSSTKKGLSGYIGQKGIGFKSVFSVSDQPEIHSNGFHIKFDRAVSMLEPSWIDETDSVKWPPKTDADGTYYETCLRLKLDEKAIKHAPKLTENLEEIFDQKLIIFLNKIRRMIFEDRKRAIKFEHSRQILASNWILVQAQNWPESRLTQRQSTVWMLQNFVIENPSIRRNDVVISKSELVIAIKFHQFSTTEIEEDLDPDQPAQNVLSLDTDDGLLPIYAYLPTTTVCFRFIVQGDFVLASSRESILEHDEWNKLLLSYVPNLFVTTIDEMMRLCHDMHSVSNFGNISAACVLERSKYPTFQQLFNAGYAVKLSYLDILSLIPQTMSNFKIYNTVIVGILKLVQSYSLVPASDGALYNSSSLLATHHLSFDPSTSISSETLRQLCGRRLVLNTESFRFNDNLAKCFNIPKLDSDCILKCLQVVSDTSEMDIENITQSCLKSYESKIKVVASLLTILNSLFEMSTACSSLRNTLTGGLSGSQLSHDVKSRIRKLRIFPVGGKQIFSSLEKTLFLVNKSNKDSIGELNCLAIFEHLISFVDEKLFEGTIDSGKGSGDQRLKQFLLNNFADPLYGTTGGIYTLLPDIIIETIIIPAYKKFSPPSAYENRISPTGINSKDLVADRIMYSAFLAYLFLTKGSSPNELNRLFGKTKIVVTTLSAREKKGNELHWTNPRLCVLSPSNLEFNADAVEVHIGFEDRNSATTQLSALNTYSALRQLGWTIIDPLTTILAFGLDSSVSDSCSSSDIKSLFKPVVDLKSKGEVQSWVSFLRKAGLVDFFGIYKLKDSGGIYSPSLVAYINHMIRNRIPVSTVNLLEADVSGNLNESTAGLNRLHSSARAVDSIIYEDETDDLDLSLKSTAQKTPQYIPIYLPHRSPDLPSNIYAVSKEVHETLKHVMVMIVTQLEYFQANGARSLYESDLVRELRNLPWMPVHLYSKLLESSTIYFVACPSQVFAPESPDDRTLYLLGPHCLYLPTDCVKTIQRDIFTKLCCLYDFTLLSSSCQPNMHLIFSFFEWMTKQHSTKVYAEIKFMAWIYECLIGCLNRSEHSFKIKLEALIHMDSNLLWIPDREDDSRNCTSTNFGRSNSDSAEYVLGKMFKLSKIVKSDPTCRLHFSDSPIQDLSFHYNHGKQSRVIDYFCPQSYCYRCQAIEGMFGVHGLNSTRSCVHPCICQVYREGFGNFARVPRGLVKKSPSLVDLLGILRHHRDNYISSLISETKENHIGEIIHFLRMIGSNLWKCFNISSSLYPYSPSQVSDFLQSLSTEPLLPIKSSQSSHFNFVSSRAAFECICSDDYEAYGLFEDALASYKTIHTSLDQIDFKASQNSIKNSISKFIYSRLNTSDYSLEDFESRFNSILKLQKSEFETTINRILPETFFAPFSMEPLLRLLKIPMLSDLATKTVIKTVSPKVSLNDNSNFGGLLGNLLRVAYSFINKEICVVNGLSHLPPNTCEILSQSERLLSLLRIKVVFCDSITTTYSLVLGNGVSHVRSLSVNQHLESTHNSTSKNPQEPTYILHLNLQTISIFEMREIAVALISTTIRIEIALLTLNQQNAVMIELERVLCKFARVEGSIDDILKLEELYDFAPKPIGSFDLDRNVVLSDYYKQWIPEVAVESSISNSILLNSSSGEMLKDATTDCLEGDKLAKSLEAFERMNNAFLNRKKPSKVAANISKKLEIQQCLDDQEQQYHQNIESLLKLSNNGCSHDVYSNTMADVVVGDLAKAAVVEYHLSAENFKPESSIAKNSKIPENGSDLIQRIIIDGEVRTPLPQNTPKIPGVHWIVNCGEQQRFNGAHPNSRDKVGAEVDHNKSPTKMGLSAAERSRIPFLSITDRSLQISIDQHDLQVAVDLELNRDTPIENYINTEYTYLTDSPVTGRLGERLIFSQLQSRFHEFYPNRCANITWLNEVEESGKPYDIFIKFDDGVSKRCEVKTRTSNVRSHIENRQWSISINELKEATKDSENYFCILVDLILDSSTKSIHVRRMSSAGIDSGLLNALDSSIASLLLQLN